MKCPIISILKIGEGCEKTSCRHNIFWNELKLSKKAHMTNVSLDFSNCMCLLNKELTLEEIGEMWGMSRERARQIERDAIIKLLSLPIKKHTFLKELDINEDSLRERLEVLKFKKYKK